MSKEIKYYLHLYLGADVKVKRKNDTEFHIGRICEVTKKSNHGDWIQVLFDDVITVTSSTWETSSSNSHWFFMCEDFIKLILRPLSDMSEEENKIHSSLRTIQRVTPVHVICVVVETPESFKYLLSIGIDLFNLITEGLAIDKTTFKFWKQ